MVTELPKRLTETWLDRLTDRELVQVYVLALRAFDDWQNYSDARTASNRLDRVEQEMYHRSMPFQSDPDHLIYR